ncbi:sigma-70 family RNA polymerase sigma factor [Nonomuraea turcica]|uniref:sigma-70 family RNA polymerase sigma factor n=1 Tax=Nonomuraea sp. G32 TaxID=3067274 RepID=UPI00273C9B9F|nr:sigma-70 family RNA polymerase sigma factor [Nonomuraea sp. G32]MDP4511846.1 sigma-70 family RNA polymerase sigma factor [Nonomuraea sp. G32]
MRPDGRSGAPSTIDTNASDPLEELDSDLLDFAEWYQNNLGALVWFAMLLGARRHEALDLTHDALVAAYPHWATIARPRAYVRASITRAYRHRRNIADKEFPVDQVPDHVARPDNALDDIEFDDQQQRVLNMIRQLPWRQRQIMAWTLDGYAPGEIAKMLGLRGGTVRVNLLKARNALKNLLVEGGPHA